MSILHVDDLVRGGTDQQKIEKAISLAQASAHENKTSTIYFAERTYMLDRPLVVKSHVFLSSTGQGRRSTRLMFLGVKANSALITLREGNASGLRGMDIRTEDDSNANNVVGLYCESLSSCVICNFSIDMTTLGENCVGVAHARNEKWGESNTFEKFDIRAPRPVVILSGDNLVFRDFDVSCIGPVSGDSISACFQGGSTTTPDHWVIGPGSGQKGDHAFYLRSKVNRVGSGLIIRDFRWEQGNTNDKAAWVVDVHRDHPSGAKVHALELLVMSGCRNSERPNSTEFQGLLKVDVGTGNGLYGSQLGEKY